MPSSKGSAILHRQTGSCMDHVALPPPVVRLVAMLSQHDQKASNLAPDALEPSKRSHLRRRTTASRKKPTAVAIRDRLHRLHPPELPGSRVTQGQKAVRAFARGSDHCAGRNAICKYIGSLPVGTHASLQAYLSKRANRRSNLRLTPWCWTGSREAASPSGLKAFYPCVVDLFSNKPRACVQPWSDGQRDWVCQQLKLMCWFVEHVMRAE